MSRSKKPSLEHSLKIFPRVAGGLAVAVGLMVLVGWWLDVSAFKSVLPGLVTMKANTALTFILAGIALWLLASNSSIDAPPRHPTRVRFARACAAVVALLGLLTLSEYLFGWDLGIDQLLIREVASAAQTAQPGRMSVMTALNFIALGVAFLLIDVETRGGQRPAQWLALVVGLDALLAILGYAYGVQALYRVSAYSSMALHTAVMFFVFSIGFLCVRLDCGWIHLAIDQGPGGLLVRRLLPAAVLVPSIVGGLLLAWERVSHHTFEFGLALFAASNVVVFSTLVWWTARSIRRSDDKWREAERSLRASEEKFHLLVEGVTDYAIMLFDAQGNIESWNSGAQRIKGYASEEIVERNFACFYSAEDQKLGKPEETLRLAEAHGRHEEEGWRVRKNGSQFFADAITTALKDSEGKLRGFAMVTRDITERKRAEEEREKSEQRLRAITDNLSEGLVIASTEGQLLHWNEASRAMFGFRSVEEGLRKLPEFVDTFELATLDGRILKIQEWPLACVIAGERVRDLELRLRRIGIDRSFVLSFSGAIVKDEGGKTIAFLSFTDITERKRMEEELRASEQRYRFLAETMPQMVWTAQPDGNVDYYNQRWYDYTGLTLEQTKDWGWQPVLHPDDLTNSTERWTKAFTTGSDYEIEYRLKRAADGVYRWHLGRAFPLRDRSGEIVHWVGTCTDIDDQKRAEEQLKASLKNVNDLKIALDEHAIVAITDPQGKITFVNDKFCAISKYSRKELLGQDHRIINSSYHPKDFIRDLWTTIARGKVWKGEIKNEAKDGTFYWVDTAIVPFLNAEGKPYQYVAIRADITDRKQQAEELKHANEALERSNLDLQQFAYVTSHDLQTPLRNISGFVQLLKMKYADTLDEQANDWIRRTVQSIEQMHTLIRDVLAYSRVDSRARPFKPIPLREVFNDVAALLEVSAYDASGRVTCDELPTVMGDRSQLVQLLQNLIGNGFKYHGDEPPHVHVSAKRDGTEWVVSVRDNGIGIAPKHHERIFDVFKRLQTQQEYPGTGIGLAICRRVVHRHGGRIWVESEFGHGSVFNFTIPERTVD